MKGKKLRLFYLVLAFVFALPLFALARNIAPVVSMDWLEKSLNNSNLIVVDIRKVEEYKEGNIPNSINVFYGSWAIKKNGLDNELPEDDDLFDVIGSAGIKAGSHVVVVGKTDTATDLVNMTRVAWTLIYGGVENVAILDGGFNKWKEGKKTISTETIKPKAGTYQGKANKSLFAKKEYVVSKIGKANIIDTRMPDFFFGVSKLDFVERAGHVKGAVALPSPWIFAKDGTFKSKEDLEAMAAGVIGKDISKESITYCDTGRLCSGWWFVLREMLGYKDVKAYDGSSQEFMKDPNFPVVKYSWQ
ncbi:MAG: rhodanese-like domain-containing protein [Deltaproteobacteria bacterium]|nr:rhodanese-like domain-containing protein [Deltaproteobacteria bacterium]